MTSKQTNFDPKSDSLNMAMTHSDSTGQSLPATLTLGFIGGGNMAQAIIGGLVQQGFAAQQVHVVEPFAANRAHLLERYGVQAYADAAQAQAVLAKCTVVVWAVKPQIFAEALAPVAPHTQEALHVSVMAGISSASLAKGLSSERIVRAMPNTPALIGQGMTGLFARSAVSAANRSLVDALLQGTGKRMWFEDEAALDAVTALSGSGPAYVYYFLEAMQIAGAQLGLEEKTAKALAIQTFLGATALAAESEQSLAELRAQVTSKGGTTHAAVEVLQAQAVQERFVQAILAAHARAQALGAPTTGAE